MDVHAKIRRYMRQRGWSEYRLAKESGLSQSTVSNLFNRNTAPSFATLEAICGAFGVTLSQFFAESEPADLTCEQRALLDSFSRLTGEQRKLLLGWLELMH